MVRKKNSSSQWACSSELWFVENSVITKNWECTVCMKILTLDTVCMESGWFVYGQLREYKFIFAQWLFVSAQFTVDSTKNCNLRFRHWLWYLKRTSITSDQMRLWLQTLKLTTSFASHIDLSSLLFFGLVSWKPLLACLFLELIITLYYYVSFSGKLG